jgi:hypothetical protein
MKGYVEKMIKEYPTLVEKRKVLKIQLDNFNGITDEDIITSMCFSHPEGERVQSSDLSDKTAKVAIAYKRRKSRMNDELYSYLFKEYERLDEEITFLEGAIKELPEDLSEVMRAMVLGGLSWEDTEYASCQARSTLSTKRKKAINALVRIYQIRASQMEAFLLS